MRLLPLLVLSACSLDDVGANGDFGRLAFQVTSDWYLEESNLREVGIVTGHPVRINVGISDDGEDVANGDAGQIRYRMSPSDGVDIEQSNDDEEDSPPPGMNVTVEEPGEYALEAMLRGEVFDRIDLRFDTPVAIELALFTRGPWEEEFDRVEAAESLQVEEGTQLAWLPIPLGGGAERLVGEVEVAMSADPMELVVPAENVTGVDEDDASSATAASLYFVEPGDVTVTIADTVNPGVGTQSFTVVAAE